MGYGIIIACNVVSISGLNAMHMSRHGIIRLIPRDSAPVQLAHFKETREGERKLTQA